MTTSLEVRINRLHAARAAFAARLAPSASEVCARASALIALARLEGPMTPENRRACRVAQLLEAAAERQAAEIHSLA